MAVMVGCNGKILITQSSLTTEHQQPEEYWLLRFPFSLHTGWTMAVFVMSINGFFNAFGLPEFIQLILGFVSLAAFAGISWKMLLANGDEPNYAIPAIVAWVLVSTFVFIKMIACGTLFTFLLTKILNSLPTSLELHLVKDQEVAWKISSVQALKSFQVLLDLVLVDLQGITFTLKKLWIVTL